MSTVEFEKKFRKNLDKDQQNTNMNPQRQPHMHMAPQVVLGQGYPVVTSKFKDPDDPDNSFWSPESVPAVKAASWAANVRDGLCGIRPTDEDIDWDDPSLNDR